MLRLCLKYDHEGEPDHRRPRSASRRPGPPRVRGKADAIPQVLGGLGVAILSTSQGLMTGHEGAEQARLGGEVLCKVW